MCNILKFLNENFTGEGDKRIFEKVFKVKING